MFATTQQINEAKRKLIADGWIYIMGVMTDGNTKNYGSLFDKDGQTFYLNHETALFIL